MKTGINSVFFKNEINDKINKKIFLYVNNREKFVVKLYKNIHRLKRGKTIL